MGLLLLQIGLHSRGATTSPQSGVNSHNPHNYLGQRIPADAEFTRA